MIVHSVTGFPIQTYGIHSRGHSVFIRIEGTPRIEAILEALINNPRLSIIINIIALDVPTCNFKAPCYFRVAGYEARNKMGVSNLAGLFGPTMMTVHSDPVSVNGWLATLICDAY